MSTAVKSAPAVASTSPANGHQPTGNVAPPTHREDPLLSCEQAGNRLGKHKSTIHRWAAEGLLKAVRMPSGTFGIRESTVNHILLGLNLVKESN